MINFQRPPWGPLQTNMDGVWTIIIALKQALIWCQIQPEVLELKIIQCEWIFCAEKRLFLACKNFAIFQLAISSTSPVVVCESKCWLPPVGFYPMAIRSAENKVTSTFYIYTQEVRILQNELKVKNVQLWIWASSNLKLTTNPKP